jgi:outer membrane translocation and assembly module TamA
MPLRPLVRSGSRIALVWSDARTCADYIAGAARRKTAADSGNAQLHAAEPQHSRREGRLEFGGRMLMRAELLPLCAAAVVACATIPKHQYAVADIEWVGVQDMEPESLEACLATRERPSVTLRLGLAAPSCGRPPFDSAAPSAELWSWPWTDWPLFDPAILAVDRERVERWYHARGYYGARLVEVRTYTGERRIEPSSCTADDCTLELVFRVSEGEPVHVADVAFDTREALPAGLEESLHDALTLQAGDRFDEARYAADKEALKRRLGEASYAGARVEGRVVIDRAQRTAHIRYDIDAGPRCVFGRMRVRGAEGLPEFQIIETADIPRGEPYRPEIVADAQSAIFSLGVFSAVRMEEHLNGETVDLVAVVQRAELSSWRLGLGVQSGSITRQTSDETYSVPEWDVHARVRYEDKNFLGGLRQLRIEDRISMIFLEDFPGVPASGPRPGNLLAARLTQPGALEKRTRLIVTAAWDLGPDPYQGFFRNDVAAKIALERMFFRDALTARVAVQHDLFDVIQESEAPEDVASYKLPFLEQQLMLDLRDNRTRPMRGAFFSVIVQEAFRLGGWGSWSYVRVVPDARAYVPVFWDIVLAARFMLGALFVYNADASLPELAAELGPQVYRLRGGGANGNRGFAAGRLGDGIDGGTRRWESSIELRIPLGGNLGLTLFGDAGDVHQQPSFRFSHLNTSVGVGLRYYSVIGAVRFDAGWRVPGAQVVGGPEPEFDASGWPSALHLTIGEAF